MPWFPRLGQRDRQPEVMDQQGLDPSAHHAALVGLSRVNWISGSASILWPLIEKLARQKPGLRILDVATGAGDVPVALAQRAARAGLSIQVSGCDISPVALDHARQRASKAGVTLDLFTHDILRDPLPTGYDVISASLFLHHLTEEEAVVALERMRTAASHAVLVNDLLRSSMGYALAWIGTRFLTRSPIVHTDGPLSVRAAFTETEVVALAEKAGLVPHRITHHWPYRFLLTWERP